MTAWRCVGPLGAPRTQQRLWARPPEPRERDAQQMLLRLIVATETHCALYSRPRAPRDAARRLDACSTGPLALVSAACPALLELEVDSWHLDQPPAPLAHLTSLHAVNFSDADDLCAPPGGTPPLRRLVAAAPRLEVLSWRNGREPSVAAAAEGHPCLRELYVSGDEEAWFRAIPLLPAL